MYSYIAVNMTPLLGTSKTMNMENLKNASARLPAETKVLNNIHSHNGGVVVGVVWLTWIGQNLKATHNQATSSGERERKALRQTAHDQEKYQKAT